MVREINREEYEQKFKDYKATNIFKVLRNGKTYEIVEKKIQGWQVLIAYFKAIGSSLVSCCIDRNTLVERWKEYCHKKKIAYLKQAKSRNSHAYLAQSIHSAVSDKSDESKMLSLPSRAPVSQYYESTHSPNSLARSQHASLRL